MIQQSNQVWNILIGAEYTPRSDWLSFAAWYSLKKHFPDSPISISLPKKARNVHLFRWLDRCKLRRLFRNNLSPMEHTVKSPSLFIPDHTLMLRGLSESEMMVLQSLKTESLDIKIDGLGENQEVPSWLINNAGLPVFFRFTEQIGHFNLGSWEQQTKVAPFGATWHSTTNIEKLVQHLWGKMHPYWVKVKS